MRVNQRPRCGNALGRHEIRSDEDRTLHITPSDSSRLHLGFKGRKKGGSLSSKVAFFPLKPCRTYKRGAGGLGPTSQAEHRPLLLGSGKMQRKSFGMKQANKHTPKRNNTKSPTPKTFHLQTCFCHCQRFRIATFGRLWPQTPGLCSFPKAPKIKNSLWQKQYVCKQKGFIFEKLNSSLDAEGWE